MLAPFQFKVVDHIAGIVQRVVDWLNFARCRRHLNISLAEITALPCLRRCNIIVIKPEDRSGALVVWCKDNYWVEALRQFPETSFYHPLLSDPTASYLQMVFSNIPDLISSTCVPYRLQPHCQHPTKPDYLLPLQYSQT